MIRYDNERGHYVLSTGREFYANGGILGLGPDAISVTEGYDGSVHIYSADFDLLPFTPDERREIAEEMVRRWTWWRDNPEIEID